MFNDSYSDTDMFDDNNNANDNNDSYTSSAYTAMKTNPTATVAPSVGAAQITTTPSPVLMDSGVVIRYIYTMLIGLLGETVPTTLPVVAKATGEVTRVELQSYMERLVRRSRMEVEVLVQAGVYIERFLSKFPKARAERGGSHRLFLTALMLASKWLDDITYTNKNWAKLGMFFPLAELNTCELELLAFLGFSLGVTPSEFENLCESATALADNSPAARTNSVTAVGRARLARSPLSTVNSASNTSPVVSSASAQSSSSKSAASASSLPCRFAPANNGGGVRGGAVSRPSPYAAA